DRTFGRDGAGRGSDLDAAGVADARQHGVYVLDYPRGVSHRHRSRQSFRNRACATNGATGLRFGLGPIAPDGGNCVDGLHAGGIIAVLAGDHFEIKSVAEFSTEPVALSLGGAAGNAVVGREFSAGARGGVAGTGSG